VRPAATRSRPGSDNARARILRAAAHLYTTRGYEATSIREIAAAAGITKPLVHYHFGSKEHLYSTLLRESIDGCRTSILEIRAQDLAPDARLHALLKAQFDRAREAPEIVAFANQVLTMPAMPPLGFDYRSAGRELFELYVGFIADGQACGAFRAVDARAVVVMAIATVTMYVSAVLAGSLPAVPPRVEDTVCDLLLRGVATPARTAARTGARRLPRAAAGRRTNARTAARPRPAVSSRTR
jgi:AcrR family transcriptional regulator